MDTKTNDKQKTTETKVVAKEDKAPTTTALKADSSKPQTTPTSKPLTMIDLKKELDVLQMVVSEHTHLIAELQEALARKRKPPASNGKIQILDKKTGEIYPSKNNAYQSLLKAGELKDLVAKGVFGDVPEKNTFGWYALIREWPDRFEEVKQPAPSESR